MRMWYGDMPFSAAIGDRWTDDDGREYIHTGEDRWSSVTRAPSADHIALMIVDSTLGQEGVPLHNEQGAVLTRMARIRWLGDQRRKAERAR